MMLTVGAKGGSEADPFSRSGEPNRTNPFLH